MDNKYKVSVITPLYNSSLYIDKNVESFLNQDLDNIELILVDDASPDNSLEKAREYEKKYKDKIRVLHYEINRRAGGARNFGLFNALGEYVCFVDVDDIMKSDMLSKLYNKAKENDYDIVDCDYLNHDILNDTYNEQISLTFDRIGLIDNLKLNLLFVSAGRIFTKIYKRDMLINNKLLYPENIRFEDNGTCFYLKAKNIGKVNECLYIYSTNQSSSQNGTLRKVDCIIDRIKASIFLLETVKKNNMFDLVKEGLTYKFIEIGYASNIFLYLIAFYKINFDNLKIAYDVVNCNFKNYKRNKYVKTNISLLYKMLMLIYEKCPFLLNIIKKIMPIIRKIYKRIK